MPKRPPTRKAPESSPSSSDRQSPLTISHLHLENFRCFETLYLDFQKCHALIGENGAGKTAILEAIDFVTTPSFGSSRLDEQDFNSLDRGDIKIELKFAGVFWMKVPDGYATQAVPCSEVSLTIKRRVKASPGRALSDPFVVEHFGRPLLFASASARPGIPPAALNLPESVTQSTEGYVLRRKSGTEMNLSTIQLSLRNELVNFPNVFLFDKDRETQSKVGFNSLLQKIVRDLNWRFRSKWDSAATAQHWETFYQSVIGTVEDAKTGRIVRPLQQQAEGLIGGDFGDLELSLLDIEQPFTKAFLTKRTATNQIEQRRLGSGVSILIAYLLLDIISSLSKEQIIYLIDEPELHLHPQLQARFFQRLRNSQHQTVFSTQSDSFVRLDNWRSVTRVSQKHQVFPTEAHLSTQVDGKTITTHLDEIGQWYKHELVYQRADNEIFFARRCVLVEGPVERYALPVLLAKLKLPLGEVTVVSANGKAKLPYFQLLCRAFTIPYFTLYDRDGKGSDDRENTLIESWAADSAIAWFDASFEALMGVGRNSSRKGSQVLAEVDAIAAESIPEAIKQAMMTISQWATRN